MAAFVLNFFLNTPDARHPVAAIVARTGQGMSNTAGVQAIYEQHAKLFSTDKTMQSTIFLYVRKRLPGRFRLFV